MQQAVAFNSLEGSSFLPMASRATSLGIDDTDLGAPHVLLAQLQALQNQASRSQSTDLNYALINNQENPASTSPMDNPFLAVQQLQLGLANQQKRGPPRQRRNEEQIRRTVYINDVDHAVAERDLATFFLHCGPIVDCRICGDANSAMRFAFIEFQTELGAHNALSLTGTTLGTTLIKVSPSKTAIVPVNNQYLPRSYEEQAAVSRTVYVANIHRAVERDALHAFFLNLCGTVSKIRLLGDAQHDTKIAFVEFATAEGAAGALRCTGALLGPLPIRVSASKTPVRTENRRTKEQMAHGAAARSASLPLSGTQAMMLDQTLTPGNLDQLHQLRNMNGCNGGHGHGGLPLSSAASLPAALLLPPSTTTFPYPQP
ncbi:hypothetical protein Ndes2526B_g06198 [Nannochloris sp. 'desiccata']